MLKIAIILGLLTTLAYANPVYTEGESYQIEVLEDGQIQVRKATRVYKDGVEISKTYHRHVLAPDTTDLSNEVQKVQDIAEVVWTPDIIKEYKDKQEKQMEGIK